MVVEYFGEISTLVWIFPEPLCVGVKEGIEIVGLLTLCIVGEKVALGSSLNLLGEEFVIWFCDCMYLTKTILSKQVLVVSKFRDPRHWHLFTPGQLPNCLKRWANFRPGAKPIERSPFILKRASCELDLGPHQWQLNKTLYQTLGNNRVWNWVCVVITATPRPQ